MNQSTTYLGLCAKIDPPLIGVYYKSKDGKKKVYNILLHKLVFNPNVEEVTKQLYQQHPHILKEDKISAHKIAEFVRRIQIGLNIDDGQEDQYADQEFEQEQHHQPDDDDFDFQEPNAKLNRSS